MSIGNWNGEKERDTLFVRPYATALLNDYPGVVEKAVRVAR